MKNPLNKEQISTAAAYLSTPFEGDHFQVNSPMQQMTQLLAEIERHPSHFDDLNAPDSHYTLLKKHASNSLDRADDALIVLAPIEY